MPTPSTCRNNCGFRSLQQPNICNWGWQGWVGRWQPAMMWWSKQQNKVQIAAKRTHHFCTEVKSIQTRLFEHEWKYYPNTGYLDSPQPKHFNMYDFSWASSRILIQENNCSCVSESSYSKESSWADWWRTILLSFTIPLSASAWAKVRSRHKNLLLQLCYKMSHLWTHLYYR